MSENTKIEWCDHTFNPWEGCQKIGPGCDHCYADARNARFGGGVAANWGPGAPRRRTSPANWALPVKWNKKAGIMQSAWAHGVELHGGDEAACIAAGFIKPQRPKVFCASLADVFDNAVDPQWRADLFALIESTPNLDWLLLTKRIGNVDHMVPEATDLIDYGEGWQSMWGQGAWPENVWLGATICNQEEADRDIPKLLAVPAAKRFLSIEPLLGPVDLTNVAPPTTEGRTWHGIDTLTPANRELRGCIDWVIVGGESGHGARPMHPDWARSLRDQCATAGVPFLFKQWGEWRPMRLDEVPIVKGINCNLVSDGSKPVIASGCHYMAHQIKSMIEDPAYSWQHPVLKVGKKAAGRLLDGITHDGSPS